MKFIGVLAIAVVLVVVVALAGMGLAKPAGANVGGDFLRLHIRANSDSADDQAIKFDIKQAIVNELTPIFAEVKTKREAILALEAALPRIEEIANKTIADKKLKYASRAAVKSEFFPSRAYATASATVTLPQGDYDALVLDLGEGKGDNWWCAIYPPLCLLENDIGGSSGIRYRSKLQDLLKGI